MGMPCIFSPDKKFQCLAIGLQAGPFENMGIITGLVKLFDRPGAVDRMGQQKPAAISIMPDTHRDTCHKGDQGRIKSILQQNGRIEMMCPQFFCQSDLSGGAPVYSLVIINQHPATWGQASKTGATQGFARTVIRASGKFFRTARTAGVVITASPIQLVERIRRLPMRLTSIFFISYSAPRPPDGQVPQQPFFIQTITIKMLRIIENCRGGVKPYPSSV